MVRIQDSQSWHRGSIPLSTTKVFFMYWLLLVSLQLVEKTTASYFFIPTQVTLSPLWINDNYPS